MERERTASEGVPCFLNRCGQLFSIAEIFGEETVFKLPKRLREVNIVFVRILKTLYFVPDSAEL